MAGPSRPGTKALEALDALLSEAGVMPAPVSPLDRPHLGCDLCGAIELCPRCTPNL